jgi:hypothetical protein
LDCACSVQRASDAKSSSGFAWAGPYYTPPAYGSADVSRRRARRRRHGLIVWASPQASFWANCLGRVSSRRPPIASSDAATPERRLAGIPQAFSARGSSRITGNTRPACQTPQRRGQNRHECTPCAVAARLITMNPIHWHQGRSNTRSRNPLPRNYRTEFRIGVFGNGSGNKWTGTKFQRKWTKTGNLRWNYTLNIVIAYTSRPRLDWEKFQPDKQYHFRLIWQILSNRGPTRLKRFISWFPTKLCN